MAPMSIALPMGIPPICSNNKVVSTFQNDVARLTLEEVDIPDLNMDVE